MEVLSKTAVRGLKRSRKFVIALLAVQMIMSCHTVYAEGEEDEYEEEPYYSEESYEEEWDEEYTEEYEEEEYEEYDEEYTEEYIEEEQEEEEYWEYSEESYEETVSEVSEIAEVSVEESSEPIIKRDPLAYQKDIDVLLPADVQVSQTVSESSEKNRDKQTQEMISESSAAEKVLNIADLAQQKERHTTFSVMGILLWVLIILLTGAAVVILVNTKASGEFRRRRYYRSAKHMTKKHIK